MNRTDRRGWCARSASLRNVLGGLAGVAGLGMATVASGQAAIGTYVGQQITQPTGVLSFTWPGSSGSLLNYIESGLRVSCAGIGQGQACTGGPRGGGCCRPLGFSTGGYYYGGGVAGLTTITRADGGAMSALEFQVGDYYNGCAYPGGDGTIYVWALVSSGGNVTSFDVNVPSGTFIGFQGVFDRVRIGAYVSAEARNTHLETYPQAIAMDSMRYAASDCPGFAAPASVYACADGTHAFSVAAVGGASSPLAYQWQWQSPGDTRWTDVVDGPNAGASALAFTATGAQAATLSRTGTLAGGSVINLRCVVSNECSGIASAPAVLAITPAPTLTDQPLDLPLCAGPAYASFFAQATTTPSDPGPFTYQWQRSTNGTVWHAMTDSEGTTGTATPYLGLSLEQTGDGAGQYRCVVSNACSSTTSQAATLSYGHAPAIYAQPGGARICAGGTTELDVDIGNQPLASQWRYESPAGSGQYVDVAVYWNTEPGTGLTFYTLGAATPGMSVSYVSLGSHPATVRFVNVLSNACGTLTSTPAEITVCVADFNCTGQVTVQDIFEFLAAWFAGDPRADVNGDLSQSVQDIFDFLGAWFAGCV